MVPSPSELSGQPTVLAKPAIKVMPVIAPRVAPVDAPQRTEGGVVEAKAHADAEQQPGRRQRPDRRRRAEQREARRQKQIGGAEHRLPPTRSICRPTRGPISPEMTSDAENAAKNEFEEMPRS